jgi:hypothetical protein
MPRRIFFAAFLACLLCPCPAGSAAPQHVGENFTMPISDVIFNDCTGEEVAIEGFVHFQFRAHELPDGFRAEATSSYRRVRGTGLESGARYTLVGTDKSQVDFRRPFPARSLFNLKVLVLRQGGGHSFFRLQVRFTANANGRITSDIERITVTCR